MKCHVFKTESGDSFFVFGDSDADAKKRADAIARERGTQIKMEAVVKEPPKKGNKK